MNERGISAIVATVLVILITVAGVAVIWVGVLPMLQRSFIFDELDGRVSVLSSGGYTVYDAERGVASVQVKRDVDEGTMERIKVSFLVGGDSVSSSVIAPESGGTKVYNFDLSGYGAPDGVEVSPIFSKGSSEKVGSVTSSVDLSSGRIKETLPITMMYDIGEDYFIDFTIDDLVGWWEFDNGVVDSAGENNGALVNGASIVNGELVLDGYDDHFNCGNDVSLTFLDEMTICLWLKAANKDEYGYIFSRGGRTSYGFHFNGAADTVIFYTSASDDPVSDAVFSESGEWVFASVAVDSTGDLTFYKNGVSAGVGSGVLLIDDGYDTFIGKRYGGSVITHHFNGTVDDVMVFNRSLSGEEIAAIYEARMKS